MTENEDRRISEILDSLGQVEPPAPGALEAARGVLWQVVAEDMLATPGRADDQAVKRRAAEMRRQAERRRPAEPGS
jgi:hypothetical protein